MIDAIRGAISRARSLGRIVNLNRTGNIGVGIRGPRRSPRWRYIGSHRVRVMTKLDESKVIRIIREKRKGTPNGKIAEEAGVSVRWVQEMARKYRGVKAGEISYPATMGRPKKSLPGRREHSAVLSALSRDCSGAVSLERKMEKTAGMHMPHNTMHPILRDADIAESQPKKTSQSPRPSPRTQCSTGRPETRADNICSKTRRIRMHQMPSAEYALTACGSANRVNNK